MTSNKSIPVQAHKVQFLPFCPTALTKIAFNKSGDKLALLRESNQIEEWRYFDNDGWTKICTIPGSSESPLEDVCWAGDRLFATGLHGFITEYSLDSLLPLYHLDTLGGALWAMEAVSYGNNDYKIAVACEDGSVRLFDVSGDNRLEYGPVLPKIPGRLVTLAWNYNSTEIAAGSSTGGVYIYDVPTKTLKTTIAQNDIISLGAADYHEQQEKMESNPIWTVKYATRELVVTGDALGNIHFWNPSFGTLVQSFAHHRGDVLALAVSENYDHVYAAGVDSTIVEFTHDSELCNWKITNTSKNQHTHDIRTLAFSPSSPEMLFSGGMDTKLVITDTRIFNVTGEITRVYSTLNHNYTKTTSSHLLTSNSNVKTGATNIAHSIDIEDASKQMLLFQQTSALRIYALGKQAESISNSNKDSMDNVNLPIEKNPQELLLFTPKSKFTIHTSVISENGEYFAYSTPDRTKLYAIAKSSNTAKSKIDISPVTLTRGNNYDNIIAHGLNGKTSDKKSILPYSTENADVPHPHFFTLAMGLLITKKHSSFITLGSDEVIRIFSINKNKKSAHLHLQIDIHKQFPALKGEHFHLLSVSLNTPIFTVVSASNTILVLSIMNYSLSCIIKQTHTEQIHYLTIHPLTNDIYTIAYNNVVSKYKQPEAFKYTECLSFRSAFSVHSDKLFKHCGKMTMIMFIPHNKDALIVLTSKKSFKLTTEAIPSYNMINKVFPATNNYEITSCIDNLDLIQKQVFTQTIQFANLFVNEYGVSYMNFVDRNNLVIVKTVWENVLKLFIDPLYKRKYAH